jgi:hypothetical protein
LHAVIPAADPITDFLNRDYAALGGWGLFLMLAVFIIIGTFREWWVPGPRHRRTEMLLQKSMDTVSTLTKQNEQLIAANEITKHFFEETAPRRSQNLHNGDSQGGAPS